MAHWSRKKKKHPSYLMEMLTHKYSINSGLAALAAGTLFAIPFGWAAALPLVGYLTATGLAALTVPDSKWFRHNVDERRKIAEREATREHLVSEIQTRVGLDHEYWKVYGRLMQRRDALRKVAGDNTSALTLADVDGLDDATVDFLGLWLGRIAIYERSRTMSEAQLQSKIAAIDAQIESSSGNELLRLKKAKAELSGLLERRNEMRSREAAAEAAMLSMADTFDEVYQRVMANPGSREEISTELTAAVDRMNIEEELDFVLEEEVEAVLGP